MVGECLGLSDYSPVVAGDFGRELVDIILDLGFGKRAVDDAVQLGSGCVDDDGSEDQLERARDRLGREGVRSRRRRGRLDD